MVNFTRVDMISERSPITQQAMIACFYRVNIMQVGRFGQLTRQQQRRKYQQKDLLAEENRLLDQFRHPFYYS
jgi:hypothetical protein